MQDTTVFWYTTTIQKPFVSNIQNIIRLDSYGFCIISSFLLKNLMYSFPNFSIDGIVGIQSLVSKIMGGRAYN